MAMRYVVTNPTYVIGDEFAATTANESPSGETFVTPGLSVIAVVALAVIEMAVVLRSVAAVPSSVVVDIPTSGLIAFGSVALAVVAFEVVVVLGSTVVGFVGAVASGSMVVVSEVV